MRKIKLKTYQDNYIFSAGRFPAMVSAWGTGKSMSLIFRALHFSQKFRGNLGIIFRKEFTDLRDSTMSDFETYTGQRISRGDKTITFKNGSQILFRHLEELNNLQNVNLGWFAIDQAEELETEETFFMLQGRLRRQLGQNGQRSGFIVANTRGQNWIKKIWKDTPPSREYTLYEATTFDNADNLPLDYLESLKELEKSKPAMYRRFVLNSWADEDIADFVIPRQFVEEATRTKLPDLTLAKRIISNDPARFGDDEIVTYVFHNAKMKDADFQRQKSTTEIAGKLTFLANKEKADGIVIDEIGLGAGVVDQTRELFGKDKVYGVNSAEKCVFSDDQKKFLNKRAKMWFDVAKMFEDRKVNIFSDEELINQLCSVKYRFQQGRLRIEEKEEIKKRIGRSPDRADCLIQGLAMLPFVKKQPVFWSDNEDYSEYKTKRRSY